MERDLESNELNNAREQWRSYPLAKTAMAPFGEKIFVDSEKIGKLGLAPLRVITSGQQTFPLPPYEILNIRHCNGVVKKYKHCLLNSCTYSCMTYNFI